MSTLMNRVHLANSTAIVLIEGQQLTEVQEQGLLLFLQSMCPVLESLHICELTYEDFIIAKQEISAEHPEVQEVAGGRYRIFAGTTNNGEFALGYLNDGDSVGIEAELKSIKITGEL